MAIAATISATAQRSSRCLQRHRLRRLLRDTRACSTRARAGVGVVRRRRRRVAGSAARSTGGRPDPSAGAGPCRGRPRTPRGSSPNSRARPSRSVSQRARSAGVPAHVVHHLVQRQRLVAALDVTHRRPPLPWQHLGVHLEEHDHAALGPQIAHVVRHVGWGTSRCAPGRHRDLLRRRCSCSRCPPARRSPPPPAGGCASPSTGRARSRRSPTRAGRVLKSILRTRLSGAKAFSAWRSNT